MPNDPGSSSAFNLIPVADSNALIDPEKLIAAYFNSSTAGLGILSSELRVLAINEKLADINGKPTRAHLGRTVREVLGEDLAQLVELPLRRVLSTGEPLLNFEVSGVLPGRTEAGHWIKDYFPIRDAAGTVTRVCVVVVEITDQKKLEESVQNVTEKLRTEMDRLQMLLEVSSLLASNWNLQQVFPQVSARIRRVLRQEYASFELRDANTGLLVRQAEDFPLGKGLVSAAPVSMNHSPGGLSLKERSPLIFTKDQLQTFESDISRNFLAEGLQSLCCVPLVRPKGALGVLVLGSTRQDAFQIEDLSLLNQVAEQLAIAIENHRSALEIEALKERLAEVRKHLEGEVRSTGLFAEIVGDSPALTQVLEQVVTVAASDATVLILGETGTGKELIARAIHRMSRRKNGSFVKVNCAAIPTGLLESELFGHEKGAFTGAISQKIGRMELADGGTFFLDEVGDISLDLQPKLLRVLQDQEFERLGSIRTIKVNLRLIAATNRDLAKGVAEHEFRSDLFYRLNVFPIRMPPLRERREDIPVLVRHFVRKFAQRMDRHIESIPSATMRSLTEWPWPGNVRELENLMERSVILSEGSALKVPLNELRAPGLGVVAQADRTLNDAEREHIVRVLRQTHGILSGPDGAAHRLGLKRTTLQSKMQRLKITRRDYLDSW